jgi:hypothetical protein
MGQGTLTLGTINTEEVIAQTAHGFSVGDVLRPDGAGEFTEAQADTAANSEAVGVVSEVVDANTFVIVYAGVITGLSGLTAGEGHFLSDSVAGLLTSTEPTGISKPILVALSATEGFVAVMRGIDGSGGSGGGGALTKLGEVTVTGSAAQAMEITGLSIAEGEPILIAWSIESAGAGGFGVKMYFNGDTTQANYFVLRLLQQGSGFLSQDQLNQTEIGRVQDSDASSGFVGVLLDQKGFPTWHADYSRMFNGSNNHVMGWTKGTYDGGGVQSDINAIRLDSGVSGGMAIGSKMIVHRRD